MAGPARRIGVPLAAARTQRRKCPQLRAICVACPLHIAADQKESAMKNVVKKLRVHQQTIRVLAGAELSHAAGGWIRPPITWSCPQPSQSACCPRTEE